jgi:hypothetical protein
MILDPSVQVAHHFPGFGRLARLYFWRTFWWMKFFRHEARCLTKSAPTTAGSARGVAAGSGLLPLLLASFAFPPLVVPALLLLLAHVLQFRKFYALAWERNPLLLPPYLVLSGIFSAVIVSGAAVSLADSLLRSLFGDDSHERLFSHR